MGIVVTSVEDAVDKSSINVLQNMNMGFSNLFSRKATEFTEEQNVLI